jgi:hypothetical protein
MSGPSESKQQTTQTNTSNTQTTTNTTDSNNSTVNYNTSTVTDSNSGLQGEDLQNVLTSLQNISSMADNEIGNSISALEGPLISYAAQNGGTVANPIITSGVGSIDGLSPTEISLIAAAIGLFLFLDK